LEPNHHRYWSYNSPYAKQNGGEFAFSEWTTKKDYIVPLEQRFWDWLLGKSYTILWKCAIHHTLYTHTLYTIHHTGKSKKWGLAVYEQDWLYNEFNGVPMLTR
jgi:hypothetical protein